MKTRVIPIQQITDADAFSVEVYNFNGAYRCLYKRMEESSDSAFKKEFIERFNLNDILYRSLVSLINAQKKAKEKIDIEKQQIADEIYEDISTGEITGWEAFKEFRRAKRLEKSIKTDNVFGTKSLLRRITKECNKEIRDYDKINRLKKEYREKRIQPIYVMGEANQNGNRFIDFGKLLVGRIIFKPSARRRYEIDLDLNAIRSMRKELLELQKLIDKKEISVTVSISKTTLTLSYDEEILKGFAFDAKRYREEKKEIKAQHYLEETEKEMLKECARNLFLEKKQRMMSDGKIKDRVVSVDLNPTNIGVSILEKDNSERGYRIIEAFCIDFTGALTVKIKTYNPHKDELKWFDEMKRPHRFSEMSYDASWVYDRQRKQNNKLTHEIYEALGYIFNRALYLKCEKFIIEDLNVKPVKKTDKFANESRRQVNNLWHKKKFLDKIAMKCHETGIELVTVNPVYTSFIGNIQHQFVDSTNAAVEIGRRGLFKFESGRFYPEMTERDADTLVAVLGIESDADSTGGDALRKIVGSSFVDAYKSGRTLFKKREFENRYRIRIE